MLTVTRLRIIDISVIMIYLTGIIWWGLRNARNKSSAEYFLAGRSMGWVMVGLSLFSASISTSTLGRIFMDIAATLYGSAMIFSIIP